jgi:hypothetical protein
VGASVAIGPAVSDPVDAENPEKFNRYQGGLLSTETIIIECEISWSQFVSHTG